MVHGSLVVEENVIGLANVVVRNAVLVAPAHALYQVEPFHHFQFFGVALVQNQING
jgi:hypothetical protein